MIDRLKRVVQCIGHGHYWNKYMGYYQERPHPDAHCLNCGVVYGRYMLQIRCIILTITSAAITATWLASMEIIERR